MFEFGLGTGIFILVLIAVAVVLSFVAGFTIAAYSFTAQENEELKSEKKDMVLIN